MALVLKLKKGESVERGLKRLKKVLDKEGLLKKLRDQRYFEKPCVKARKKSQRARIRNRSRRGRMELNSFELHLDGAGKSRSGPGRCAIHVYWGRLSSGPPPSAPCRTALRGEWTQNPACDRLNRALGRSTADIGRRLRATADCIAGSIRNLACMTWRHVIPDVRYAAAAAFPGFALGIVETQGGNLI